MPQRTPYPSDVSDREWNIIGQLLPQRGKMGRPPRYSRREILNAILYVTRSGCPWRMIPHDLPRGGWFITISPPGRNWGSGKGFTMA